VEYTKPHLSYDQQLDLLRLRGMAVPDQHYGLAALRRIGYYRLSAYTYPFRSRDEVGAVGDTFVDAADLDAVIALHDFDVKLRATLLAGLEAFELALRVQVAYTLGKRDTYGHLNADSALDSLRCGDAAAGDLQVTKYDVWLAKYEKRCQDSTEEDFVRHFHTKYDGRLPVWVATEVMDLGLLVRLYSFMQREDRRRIAGAFGVQRESVFRSWTVALNLMRNHCAHGDRIWNRSLVYLLPVFNTSLLDPRLAGLQGIEEFVRRKLYPNVAILASTLSTIHPYTNWPRTFATQAKKLPEGGPVTFAAMGFPPQWQQEPLWNYEPKKVSANPNPR
jgi:abortive infection bacteriophage resistance protein